MKIAQVAPLYESVPPKYYGGTERVVSYLTEELVRAGHEVTLFASGDSVTKANLVPQCHRSLRLDEHVIDYFAHHVLLTERVFKDTNAFDMIHSHIDYLPYSMIRRLETPVLTTLHGRLDLEDLVALYQEFSDIPVVSISDAQRKPITRINWQGTVHHGLPPDLYAYREAQGSYLAFLGRICPEKRVDDAIEIAKRAGLELRIAAKVDRVDQEYFDTVVRHLLDHPLIEYVGEIREAEKSEFLGNASALLFPIDWPEPFGLVMIEAFACGTPVIARNLGSVPEVMEHGTTGFVVRNVDEAVSAVKEVPSLSRKRCREVFEERFTVSRMAEDYLTIYQRLIRERSLRGLVRPSLPRVAPPGDQLVDVVTADLDREH
jgi:glycosyltransferase involved in cell wall biosynthesis